MNLQAYVTFLVIAVVLVVVDGQIIYHSGRRYMESSDAATGNSMVRLVTVLFHLAVLGLVALLSTIDFGTATALTTVVVKVGIVLLLLAVAHGISMAVIAHVRDDELAQTLTARAETRSAQSEPVVNPVPRKRERASQSIEHRDEARGA